MGLGEALAIGGTTHQEEGGPTITMTGSRCPTTAEATARGGAAGTSPHLHHPVGAITTMAGPLRIMTTAGADTTRASEVAGASNEAEATLGAGVSCGMGKRGTRLTDYNQGQHYSPCFPVWITTLLIQIRCTD